MKSHIVRIYKEGLVVNFSKPVRDIFGLLPDGNYILEIKKEPKIRSQKQNNFYWHCLDFIEKNSESWYTADEFHDYFKTYFLGKKSPIDKNITIPWSTANLSIEEFNVFLEKVLYFIKSEYWIEENDLYATYYNNNILEIWRQKLNLKKEN